MDDQQVEVVFFFVGVIQKICVFGLIGLAINYFLFGDTNGNKRR